MTKIKTEPDCIVKCYIQLQKGILIMEEIKISKSKELYK